jgi:enoyl-CoA hydratase/carnithine racemase
MYSEILYDAAGAVARLTLNRPEKRNPLGPTTLGELLHALERAKADPAVRVIVFTGAGKGFSAGGDLSAFAGRSAAGETEIKPASFVDLNLALTRAGKPTIAMVNGHAMAGGLGLVVACDIAIAAEEAEFALPEINVGLWPMMISANIFRNVSRKRGLELMLTGDRIPAAEAVRIGLITRAVPRERLEEEVAALCAKLAEKSPLTLKLGLEAFYATQDMDLEPALLHLQKQLLAVLGTEDAREGLLAFLEKRPPVWKGK